MAFKKVVRPDRKRNHYEKPSEFSFSIPMSADRKNQLEREIDEMFQGKRKTVYTNVDELIEIITESDDFLKDHVGSE